MASEPSDSELLAVMQASIDADALTDVTYEHAHQSLYLIRKRLLERSEELARLRTALESAQADRQRAVDDLFEQLRVNGSLRAESMRAAVTAILREAEVRESSDEDDPDPWKMVADWLEQQPAPQGQPLENIEGLAQAQPVCRAWRAGDTLEAAIACCDAWEPDARLIGNVRAVTLGNLLRELARLRAALESAQEDRQRAVDDLFAQLRVNESLRAETTRGAVEALRRVATLCDKPIGKFTEADRLEWTDALEALTDEVSPYELRTVAAFLEQQSASQAQPLENIEGLAQAQPVCRASQAAMTRAELATRTTPAKPEDEQTGKHLFSIRAGASLARTFGCPSNGADLNAASVYFEGMAADPGPLEWVPFDLAHFPEGNTALFRFVGADGADYYFVDRITWDSESPPQWDECSAGVEFDAVTHYALFNQLKTPAKPEKEKP